MRGTASAGWCVPRSPPLHPHLFHHTPPRLLQVYAAALSGLADLARRGDGGLLRAFFSAHVWRVLARLSFGAYCWMVLVITVDKAGAYDYPSYTDITMFINFISCFAVVLLLAYLSYLLVEQPCRALEARPPTEPN